MTAAPSSDQEGKWHWAKCSAPPLSNVTSHCGHDEISETIQPLFQIQKCLGRWNDVSKTQDLSCKVGIRWWIWHLHSNLIWEVSNILNDLLCCKFQVTQSENLSQHYNHNSTQTSISVSPFSQEYLCQSNLEICKPHNILVFHTLLLFLPLWYWIWSSSSSSSSSSSIS